MKNKKVKYESIKEVKMTIENNEKNYKSIKAKHLDFKIVPKC